MKPLIIIPILSLACCSEEDSNDTGNDHHQETSVLAQKPKPVTDPAIIAFRELEERASLLPEVPTLYDKVQKASFQGDLALEQKKFLRSFKRHGPSPFFGEEELQTLLDQRDQIAREVSASTQLDDPKEREEELETAVAGIEKIIEQILKSRELEIDALEEKIKTGQRLLLSQ